MFDWIPRQILQVIFFLIWPLVLFLTSSGCNKDGESIDDYKARVGIMLDAAERIAAFGEQQGVAWSVSMNSRGVGEVYAKQSFGMDTGVSATFNMHGNAAVERQPVVREPETAGLPLE